MAYIGFYFGGGGFKIFLEKWEFLHGEATSLLGGSGACSPENFFFKWRNLKISGEGGLNPLNPPPLKYALPVIVINRNGF